jgi:hypothetical protein
MRSLFSDFHNVSLLCHCPESVLANLTMDFRQKKHLQRPFSFFAPRDRLGNGRLACLHNYMNQGIYRNKLVC